MTPFEKQAAADLEAALNNPMLKVLDDLFAPDPRYAWLDRFGEQLRRERAAREHFSSLPDKQMRREPVGNRTRKIARILVRDGDACCYCGKPLDDDMTLEHRVSRSRGGSDDLDNLKLAHARCNQDVGNLPPDMKDDLAEQIKRWREEDERNGQPWADGKDER